MNIPWGVIADVGLKIINAVITDIVRRDALKKQMIEFVKRFDDSILENAKLRREYDSIIKKADGDRS